MFPVFVFAVVLASVTKLEMKPMKATERYKNENKIKRDGAIYTPQRMAYVLAEEMLSRYQGKINDEISVLDPAVGEGELLVSFISAARAKFPSARIKVVGYDINEDTCRIAYGKVSKCDACMQCEIRNGDFLECVDDLKEKFDFVIANPPYVRTQILGSERARRMAERYGLTGRVDIYYAFLVNTGRVLNESGIAGYITSNKFLSIKSGSSVRRFMLSNYTLFSITDYGDSKVFGNASVLPCTIVFKNGKTCDFDKVRYTSIYECKDYVGAVEKASLFDFVREDGRFRLPDGRVFLCKRGALKKCNAGDVWMFSSIETESWLRKVNSNTWLHFNDLGKVRVGIKTTADNVFIGGDWGNQAPELLHPLMTHRDAGRVMTETNCNWKVLYPHEVRDGKRFAVDLAKYPKARQYLERHRVQLEGRKYVKDAGRQWYEIWVPQNPISWTHRKIVFRDISETPQFWFDDTGAIVNGDCYWIDIDANVSEELVYLALAVANSSFIERYYDTCFNTKLYSGKRRFMAQYVEQFPLPTTNSAPSKAAIAIVRGVVERKTQIADDELLKLNELVDQMFGQD